MIVNGKEVYGVIYKIRNKVNNKIYIGQTTRKNGFKGRYCCKGVGIERVYNYHCRAIKNGHSPNKHLLQSIIKYGFENFHVEEVFDYAFSLDELNKKEKMWIEYYKSDDTKYGYNNRSGGDNYEYSSDSQVYNGIGIVCINTNKTYKSLQEASKYYPISSTTISNRINVKRNKNNIDQYLFRYVDKRDFDSSWKRCSYCGKLFKLPVLRTYKRENKIVYNNSYKYCKSCRRKGNRIHSSVRSEINNKLLI